MKWTGKHAMHTGSKMWASLKYAYYKYRLLCCSTLYMQVDCGIAKMLGFVRDVGVVDADGDE